MQIRKSTIQDVNDIMRIIASARQYMVSHGNTTQWVDGYPGKDIKNYKYRRNKNRIEMDIIISNNRMLYAQCRSAYIHCHIF